MFFEYFLNQVTIPGTSHIFNTALTEVPEEFVNSSVDNTLQRSAASIEAQTGHEGK